MSASIADYLLRLARDPQAAALHRSSDDAAHSAMDAAGLSAEQKETVLSRDADRISAAIRAELQGSGDKDDEGGIPFLMVFMVTPHEGP